MTEKKESGFGWGAGRGRGGGGGGRGRGGGGGGQKCCHILYCFLRVSMFEIQPW